MGALLSPRLALVLVALLLGGCKGPASQDTPDAGQSAAALVPCVDRPSAPTAPSEQLPCDLLPPNFKH
jgi:PBP1b-binding outer membrane lipoprotein LpoB